MTIRQKQQRPLTRTQAGLDAAGVALALAGLIALLIATPWKDSVESKQKACELANSLSLFGQEVCHSNSAPLAMEIFGAAMLALGIVTMIGVSASKRGS